MSGTKEPEAEALAALISFWAYSNAGWQDRELVFSRLKILKRTSVFHTQNPSVLPH